MKERRRKQWIALVLILSLLGGIIMPHGKNWQRVGAEETENSKNDSLIMCTLENGILNIDGSGCITADDLENIDKSKISKIQFEKGITEIGERTFEGCHNLESIDWYNIETIGAYAFLDCENLNCMAFGKETQRIEEGAFLGCDKIDFMVLPTSLSYAGVQAFPLHTSLYWSDATPEIPDDFWMGRTGTMYISGGINWEKEKEKAEGEKISWKTKTAEEYFELQQGEKLAEYYVVPEWDSLCRLDGEGTLIVSRMHQNDNVDSHAEIDFLYKLSIEGEVVKKMILNRGFYVSGKLPFESLNYFEITGDWIKFVQGCFENCKSLIELRTHGDVAFESRSFYGCSSLERLEIHGTVDVENEAFAGCSSLKAVAFPDVCQTIGDSAFEGCSSLEEVVLKRRVITIGKRAFYGCDNLNKLCFESAVDTIESKAFAECNCIETVILPMGLSYLGMGNFENSDVYWEGDQMVLEGPENSEDKKLLERMQGTLYVPVDSEYWKKKMEMYPNLKWQTWTPPKEYEETVTCSLFDSWVYTDRLQSTPVEAVVDEDGVPCIKVLFSEQYQKAAFRMPEGINVSDYKSVTIKARVCSQLIFNLWGENLTMVNGKTETEVDELVEAYPFYDSTKMDKMVLETDEVQFSELGDAVYMGVGTCCTPDNTDLLERGKSYDFYIYSFAFEPAVAKAKKIVFESEMPTVSTPTPTTSSTASPTNAPTESPISLVTDAPPEKETALSTPIPSPGKNVTTQKKKKKQNRPRLSIKKKKGKASRYLRIEVKDSSSKYCEVYMKKKGKKYVRIRLKSKRLTKGKSVIRLSYSKRGFTLWFKVRCYNKNKGKKVYGLYSKEKKIKV